MTPQVQSRPQARFPQAESVRVAEDTRCCFRDIKDGRARLIWEITARCNIDCIHCFVEHANQEMETADALRVITQFPDLPVAKVMFTGGEPFMRRDMFTLVEACLAQGVVVDVTTNLTLITAERIGHVRRLALHEITTSLDGPELVHDAIRRAPGNFRKVTRTIGELRAAGIEVDIVCVAQRLNAATIGETIDIARQAGASSITISGFNTQAAAERKVADCALVAGQYDAIAEQVGAARERHPAGFPIRTVGLLHRFMEPVPCPIQNIVGISARGEALNCLLAPVPVAERPDVRQGLKRAWDGLNRDYCCSQSGWQRSGAAAEEP